MIQLIVGNKGKGKTKDLLKKVNTEIKQAHGSIVYLDKSTKHMYELNNKIRLINVTEFPITNANEFIGFICGIISQDHDLEAMYLDSFLKIANLENEDYLETINKLEQIGEQYKINFVISISVDEPHLHESLKSKIIISL